MKWIKIFLEVVVVVVVLYGAYQGAIYLGIIGKPKKESVEGGFKVIATDKMAHFVHVSKSRLGDRRAQWETCKKICINAGQQDYCEVYMWANLSEVAKKLPVVRNKAIGFCSMKDGDINLRVLKG